MCLIDDDNFVIIEVSIVLSFCQQDTVSHQLDLGAFPDLIMETYLITDTLTQG